VKFLLQGGKKDRDAWLQKGRRAIIKSAKAFLHDLQVRRPSGAILKKEACFGKQNQEIVEFLGKSLFRDREGKNLVNDCLQRRNQGKRFNGRGGVVYQASSMERS